MARAARYFNSTNRCTAKSKTSGKQCRQYAVGGKDKCHYHGGKTPVKNGLYTKYPDAINKLASDHMDEAKAQDAISTLRQTIPLIAAILSMWVEKGYAFLPKEAAATTAMLQRLTKMVDTYEKLTNPELRTGRLIVEHDYKKMSDQDLIDAIDKLHQEASDICRTAATGEGQT